MSRLVSMVEFIEALRALPPGDPCDTAVLQAMKEHRVAPEELERYLIWDDEHYTRHLVYRDSRYDVIVLCWSVGQVTPVHDHAGQRCWMMIERGRLQIDDFCCKDGQTPRLLDSAVVGTDELHVDTDVDMCACIHRIANPRDWNRRAVSLHVYSRPFDTCNIYCTQTGTRETIDLCFDAVGPLVAEAPRSVVAKATSAG